MSPDQALSHLRTAQGFWGVRVVGGPETIFPSKAGVTVTIKDNDRELTDDEFLAQFTGSSFKLPQVVDQVNS